MDDFYIGYEPPMPRAIARFVRRATIATLVGGAALATLLATEHRALVGGTFAYGHEESVTGRLVARPYPHIVESGARSATLIVAPGKHGADHIVAAFDGTHLQMTGTRIARDGRRMLEVRPGTIRATAARSQAADTTPKDASPRGSNDRHDAAVAVELRGEIVDSKCYLGVMVPGEGHTHRACASLCLRGGIPPALRVRRPDGGADLYLLESVAGERLATDAAPWAGRTIVVSGVTTTRSGWPVLRTDPLGWRRAGQ